MTTKEYLGQIQRIDMMIANTCQDIQRLKELAVSITVPMGKEKVQTSGVGDIVGDNVAKYVTLEGQGDVAAWLEARHTIIMQINSLPDYNDYYVLYERYVNNKDVVDIAKSMGKTRQHIDRLARNAMEHFEREYKTSFRSYI